MPLFINHERIEDKAIYREACLILKKLKDSLSLESRESEKIDKGLETNEMRDKRLEMAVLLAKENVIQRTLLQQEVDDHFEFEPSYEAVKDAFERIKEHFGGEDSFEKYFGESRKTDFEIKRNIERSLKVQKYLEQCLESTLGSMEEIEHFYERRKESLYANKPLKTVLSKVKEDFLSFKKTLLYKEKIKALKLKAKIIDEVNINDSSFADKNLL